MRFENRIKKEKCIFLTDKFKVCNILQHNQSVLSLGQNTLLARRRLGVHGENMRENDDRECICVTMLDEKIQGGDENVPAVCGFLQGRVLEVPETIQGSAANIMNRIRVI